VLKQALADCSTRPRDPGWLTLANGAAPALIRSGAGDDTEEDVLRDVKAQARKAWN
jgi:hypothetical protein